MKRIAYITVAVVAAAIATPQIGFAQTAEASAETNDDQFIRESFLRAEDLWRTEGTPPDYAAAIAIYEDLAERGHARSYFRLGQLYDNVGRPEDAHDAFSSALDLGHTGARLELAKGHAAGLFGQKSRPKFGFEELKDMAEVNFPKAKFALAEAYRRGQGTLPDISAAREIFTELAEQNDPRALQRIGELALNNASSRGELEQAEAVLTESVELGNLQALIALSDVQFQAGRKSQSRETLVKASSAGVRGAELKLAQADFLKEFGSASERAVGQKRLIELAESGDTRAASAVLRLYERKSRRIKELDLNKVVNQLEDAAQNGDPHAAEALARFHRRLSWLKPGGRARHARIVDDYGKYMRVNRYVPEVLQKTYNPNAPIASRPEVAKVIDEAEGLAYFYGLRELRSIDRTAYAYVLQRELKKLGYYNGRVSGRLTRPTVKAVLKFCRDHGVYDTCIHGPLNYDSVTLTARALMNVQAQGA